ncbi:MULTISPECIES: LysR family transcriptional regulator [unclassified Caballeronia]|uniref:LysR family transcriptional regulator n=1 Tax=unclassified Caballeronia TaxID=2646786 RepID=UPI002865CDF8|nr:MULTISPECIES: LysR family transcriptional regulator [unclassified Caballeronia]MDR5825221.1 LysR family transcriptional regulator [Caballeronia sp. LZ043]MDR5883094.1 LysR family transcriptional regulator [Caballeronia sp. LZ032]
MDQTALRYFLEVVKSGSLSKASERLFVATSALSRQIGKLEEQVGTPLFERRPRGMVLTDAGRLLANHARRSQLEEERVVEEIMGLSASGRATIRIAASEGVAPDFLPQLFAHFRSTHPRAHFALDVSAPSIATQRVRDGTHDIAVCFSMAPEENVQVHYAQRAPVYALMRRGHPLASQSMLSLADLLKWPLAMHSQGVTLRQLFDIACSLEGLVFEPVFTSNYHVALQSFVRRTDAITLTGYVTVRGRLDTDGLAAISLSNPELHQRSLQVQTMAGRLLPQPVQAFVELLKEAIDKPEVMEPGS